MGFGRSVMAAAACALTVGVLAVGKTERRAPLYEGPRTEVAFKFEASDAAELQRVRQALRLDDVIRGEATDRDRALALNAWAHGLWEHDGGNEAGTTDIVAMIKRAERGERFRCVEYSQVLAAAATAVGLPARVIGLQRADVNTPGFGKGHVVAEIYLRDEGRWAFFDPQWNTAVERNGKLLNTAEFAEARADSDLKLIGTARPAYRLWISPYLHYLVAPVSHAFWSGKPQGQVVLVPTGSEAPTAFQGQPRSTPWAAVLFDRRDFYPTP